MAGSAVRFRTIAARHVLDDLVRRLQGLTPDTPRRWGTLSAHEMLCHLGDATAMVLGDRPRPAPIAARRRGPLKALVLWSPLRWPHGIPTNPRHDPRAEGTRPAQFEADLARAIDGLARLAVAIPSTLEPTHGIFGAMSARDWQRWAFKHTDHHLRQFGL